MKSQEENIQLPVAVVHKDGQMSRGIVEEEQVKSTNE